MRNYILFIILLSFSSTLILSSQGAVLAAGTSSAQFLKMGAGSRAAGMGQAFSSIADDVTATYWNPAGLSQIQSLQVGLMHNDYLLDTQYQYAGAAIPWNNNAFGLSMQRMDYGQIEGYAVDDTREDSFQAGSMAGNVTFARRMGEALSLGMTAKYIQETIDNEKASTYAADLGVLVSLEKMRLSAVLQNLGPQMKFIEQKEDLPQTVRLGISSQFFLETLLTSVEVSKPNDNDITYHAGAEYSLAQCVSFRGGYQITPGNELDLAGLKGLTGGLGIHFRSFTLDYAFVPFAELGNTHQVSLIFKFIRN